MNSDMLIPRDFAEIRLGDHVKKIGSGATPRGGSEVYQSSGIALIRSQNVYNNVFSYDGLAFISDEHARQLEGVTVEPGDILLNITGDSVARICQVPDDVLPARVNQHVAIIRPNESLLDPKYLRYYLTSPYMQTYMLMLAGAGATRNALTKGMIEDFLIPAPAINVQQAIAHILGTLDDKIELNRRMNNTLEAIARAIFQSWFVDFDPVYTKARGEQPYGMDADTAALFPDSFEDSELGPIPAGWQIKSLDEIADYQNGLALQNYPPEGDEFLPVIKIRELRQGYSDSSSDKATPYIKQSCIVDDGEVIFSWSGSLLLDFWCGGCGALNQHLFKVTSTNYPKWFFYLWTLYHLENFQSIAAGKATTMGHIQRHHISAAKTLVPCDELLEQMDMIIAPFFEAIINNRIQSRTLAELRDTLLPRLISGELRVEDMEVNL